MTFEISPTNTSSPSMSKVEHKQHPIIVSTTVMSMLVFLLATATRIPRATAAVAAGEDGFTISSSSHMFWLRPPEELLNSRCRRNVTNLPKPFFTARKPLANIKRSIAPGHVIYQAYTIDAHLRVRYMESNAKVMDDVVTRLGHVLTVGEALLEGEGAGKRVDEARRGYLSMARRDMDCARAQMALLLTDQIVAANRVSLVWPLADVKYAGAGHFGGPIDDDILTALAPEPSKKGDSTADKKPSKVDDSLILASALATAKKQLLATANLKTLCPRKTLALPGMDNFLVAVKKDMATASPKWTLPDTPTTASLKTALVALKSAHTRLQILLTAWKKDTAALKEVVDANAKSLQSLYDTSNDKSKDASPSELARASVCLDHELDELFSEIVASCHQFVSALPVSSDFLGTLPPELFDGFSMEMDGLVVWDDENMTDEVKYNLVSRLKLLDRKRKAREQLQELIDAQERAKKEQQQQQQQQKKG
ncbi:hypothetical protein HDU76_003020 [Blyttiomyces sp. JEL0837]|nr:hypothetical protein HDU76_003020 [Blyttiomyces sp. JEL0837]